MILQCSGKLPRDDDLSPEEPLETAGSRKVLKVEKGAL